MSSLSINILENAGLMMEIRDEISVVIIIIANAAPVPFRRSFAKDIILLGAPPGAKSSEGSIIRQMPVNDSSNSSIDIHTSPLAGSFM